MPFDQATIDAIAALSSAEGAIEVTPDFDPNTGDHVGFTATWQLPGFARPEASMTGRDLGEALDNLLLVKQGSGPQVVKSIRLRAAQAREAEAQAVLDAAVAERTAIEAER